MAADLNHHHRVTLDKIFSHPLSGRKSYGPASPAVARMSRRGSKPREFSHRSSRVSMTAL